MALMTELSTKPYLIRAIYEWCADSGYTPYIGVHVDQNTRVPLEYVKNGEIVLSISMQATRDLTIGKDLIQFSARFSGVSREISVPIYALASIFARENGKGMFFEREFAPLVIAPSAEGMTVQATQPQLQSVPNSPPEDGVNEPQADQNTADATQAGNAHVASAASGNQTKKGKSENDKSGSDKPKGPPRGKLRVIK